jgi:hypothetical protein
MDMQTPGGATGPMMVGLPIEQWHVVLRGVDELPHRIARAVMDELVRQLRAQSSPQAVPARAAQFPSDGDTCDGG